MKIKNYTINETFPMPSFYKEVLQKNRFCILDIETTGLSSKYHQIILIGLLYPQSNQTVVKQIFADQPQEEKDLLLHFSEEMKNFEVFITYNGVTFDYPFLKERFKKYSIPWPHDEINHFDILYFLRKCKSQLPLENLKLKTVETYLGISRRDTISGKDSVELYKNYVSAPCSALEKTILLHNYEDIYYLAKVAGIFDYFPSVNYLLSKTYLTLYKDSNPLNLYYHPNDIMIKKNSLRVVGKTTKFSALQEEVHYTSHYNFKWSPLEGSFQIEIPIQKTVLLTKDKVYYLNLMEFKPKFNSDLVEIEARSFFHQHLMEMDLHSPQGLMAVITLLNFLIYNIFEDKKLSLSLE